MQIWGYLLYIFHAHHKSLQLHEDQGKRNSSWFVYSIDELQVWKEDQRAQVFGVFIYL